MLCPKCGAQLKDDARLCTSCGAPIAGGKAPRKGRKAKGSGQPAAGNVNVNVSAEMNNKINSVLRQYYKFGFKYGSVREIMRFRQFADEMEVVLPKDDIALKDFILSSGITIGNKIYCKSEEMLRELEDIVNDVFSSATSVIYYESLFEKKQKWMEAHAITSPVMLKEYLRISIAGWDCYFSKKFIYKGKKHPEKEVVTNELKRIWGTNSLEKVDNLFERLPYIPQTNIMRVITGNDNFVRSSKREYLFVDRFRITEEEKETILNFVAEVCEQNGFVSICELPLSNIKEENYELTQPVICNAIYKKVLLGKYYLNGGIITKKKSNLNIKMLLKQYLTGKDECALDDVENKVVQLSGKVNRQCALKALYDEMVRIGKNRFIANRFVNFPIDEIDTVLDGFITNDFKAIRDVTTFAMFPICGQSWNHYLLESFCYRYSKRYVLRVIYFNDKNAGIIAKKDFNKKYNEMLAIAVARANIDLSADNIGFYLFNAGYLAKSKYVNLSEIAQLALELRKER